MATLLQHQLDFIFLCYGLAFSLGDQKFFSAGRLGIHELLNCTDGLKRLIKRKSETENIRQQAVSEGMTTLKQDGLLKVLQGLTDIHEIRRVCLR